MRQLVHETASVVVLATMLTFGCCLLITPYPADLQPVVGHVTVAVGFGLQFLWPTLVAWVLAVVTTAFLMRQTPGGTRLLVNLVATATLMPVTVFAWLIAGPAVYGEEFLRTTMMYVLMCSVIFGLAGLVALLFTHFRSGDEAAETVTTSQGAASASWMPASVR